MMIDISDVPLGDGSLPAIAVRAPGSQRPLVLVAGADAALLQIVAACCRFLGADFECVADPAGAEAVLESQSPIALVAGVGSTQRSGRQIVGAVARVDASIPVLMIAGEDSHARTVAETLADLHALQHARVSGACPDARTLADFLVSASIRRGWVGLLPA